MTKLELLVQNLKEIFRPENIPMLIVSLVIAAVCAYIFSKIPIFNEGKQKLKDAKANKRTILAHLDGKSQTVTQAEGYTIIIHTSRKLIFVVRLRAESQLRTSWEGKERANPYIYFC